MNYENLTVDKEREKQKMLNLFLDKYFPSIDAPAKQETKLIERKDLDILLEQDFIMDEILHAVVKRGYVLHGSSFNIKVFEPKTAVGQGEQHERLTAIYCTDFPPTALFNAITPKATMEETFHTCWDVKGTDIDHVDSAVFKASPNALENFGDGFIYVLSKKHVKPTPSAGEFVSEENYEPIAKIQIKRQDFVHNIEECDASRHNKDGSYKI